MITQVTPPHPLLASDAYLIHKLPGAGEQGFLLQGWDGHKDLPGTLGWALTAAASLPVLGWQRCMQWGHALAANRPPAPPAGSSCPGYSLGAGGFSVNPDHFPDLGHSSTDTRADVLEGCLGAEGVAPAGPNGSDVPDAGSWWLLSIPHGTPRLCGTPGCSNRCPTKASRTQGRGRAVPVPGFPAHSWVRNREKKSPFKFF